MGKLISIIAGLLFFAMIINSGPSEKDVMSSLMVLVLLCLFFVALGGVLAIAITSDSDKK